MGGADQLETGGVSTIVTLSALSVFANLHPQSSLHRHVYMNRINNFSARKEFQEPNGFRWCANYFIRIQLKLPAAVWTTVLSKWSPRALSSNVQMRKQNWLNRRQKSFATFPSGVRFLYVTWNDTAIEYFMIEQNFFTCFCVRSHRPQLIQRAFQSNRQLYNNMFDLGLGELQVMPQDYFRCGICCTGVDNTFTIHQSNEMFHAISVRKF